MPNGTYGRAVPRLALAVATYRARWGEWPTHAHGHGVMVVITHPGPGADPEDRDEFRADLAVAVRSRLACDDEGEWISVEGPASRQAGAGPVGYGDGELGPGDPRFREAFQWLFGHDYPLRD